MKITLGTIEYIKRLAIARQAGSVSEADHVELFDAIDCLDFDELSELFALVRVGESQDAEQFEIAVAQATIRGQTVVNQLVDMRELGTNLAAGIARLKMLP